MALAYNLADNITRRGRQELYSTLSFLALETPQYYSGLCIASVYYKV